MKQLLFLLLFPCLAMAQYQGNGNQKITLGEQTSADGLVYRGLAADTTRKPSVDTMAYILLDTNTNIIWQYTKAVNNAWTRINLRQSDTTSFNYVNTYGTQTVNGEKTFNNSIRVTSIGVGRNAIVQSNTGMISLDGSSGSMIRFYNNAIETFRIATDINGNFIQGNGRGFRFDTGGQYYALNLLNDGKIGLGLTIPSARLHIVAGTATASTAPLKFTSQGASLLNPVEAGAVEFNGTNLLFTPSTTRYTVNHGLTGSATLNFPSTTTLLSADLTITVTGAADGDVVSLGVPNAAVNANTSYSAWVSAANTVTVRFNNYSSGTVDPASALFKVFVTK